MQMPVRAILGDARRNPLAPRSVPTSYIYASGRASLSCWMGGYFVLITTLLQALPIGGVLTLPVDPAVAADTTIGRNSSIV